MHIGVIWPKCQHWQSAAIYAKMKGCQILDWIVGEREVIFTNFIHDVSMETN